MSDEHGKSEAELPWYWGVTWRSEATWQAAHLFIMPSNGHAICEMNMLDDDHYRHAALIASAPATATERDELKAEVERLREALGDTTCPRPCNGRPDDLTAAQCVAYDECGCAARAALSPKTEGTPS